MPTCLHHRPSTPLLAAADAAGPDALELMNQPLSVTASITVQVLENQARVDGLSPDEFGLFERLEEIGDTSCDGCIEVDGTVISRDHPDFDAFQNPFHINCLGILVGIGADEVSPDGRPTEPDFPGFTEQQRQDFHYVLDPEKYAPLKIIAQPEGRDFIATPVFDSQGKKRLKLNWRIPEYDLPGYEPPT